MRSAQLLLIVSALCATVSACGQPFATETGDDASQTSAGDAQTQAPAAGTGTAAPTDPGTSSTAPGGTSAAPPATTTGLCGTDAKAITYTGQAQAVIKTQCTSCHGGSTAPVMTDYASTKAGFAGGGSQAVAAGSMPLGLTLTENQKCILTQWAANKYAE